MRSSKRIAVQAHLWLGLIVGLLWSIQGLTGATLVFHRELDRWAHPEWHGGVGRPVAVDQLVAIAERRTGKSVSAIGILDAGRDLRTATYSDDNGKQNMLILDASSGAIVGERQPQPERPSDGSTSRFIYMVHERLVSGHTGEVIIGVSGCLLLSTAILGIWIAWPRRGNWRVLVTRRGWRTLPQKLYSWHRLAGLVFGFVFVAIALGGIYMTFTDSIRSAVGKIIPLQVPYSASTPAMPKTWRSAGEALNLAEVLYPNAQFVRLTMPVQSKPFYIVRMHQPGEVRAWAGSTTVTIDARTGRVLQVQDGLAGPAADRVLDAQFSIHNGEIGGLLGRLLVMMAGLALPTFYVSGLWLWLRKRSARRKAASRASRFGEQPVRGQTA